MLPLASVVLGIVGWLAGVILHELGHAFGAKLAGLRVYWFTVARLGIYFSPGAVTLMKSPLAHPSWVAASGPRSTDVPRNHLIYILCGPLFSFVGMVAASPLVVICWSIFPWNWFLLSFTSVCAISSFPNGHKMSSTGFAYDFEIIRRIRKDWDAYRGELVAYRIRMNEHGHGGLRAIDPEDRAELSSLPGEPVTRLEGAMWMLALAGLEKNADDALKGVDLCEELLPAASQVVPGGVDNDQTETVHLARVMAVVVCVTILEDYGRAKVIWSSFDASSIKRSRIRKMGEAAIALAEGNPEEASRLAEDAWQPPLPATNEHGPTYVDFELLHMIRAKAALRLGCP